MAHNMSAKHSITSESESDCKVYNVPFLLKPRSYVVERNGTAIALPSLQVLNMHIENYT